MKQAALFGDSQAQGLAPHLRSLLARYDIDLEHVDARPGFTTARFLREFDRPAGRFDLVIVVLGGNDSPGPSYAETLRSAVSVFQGLGDKVLWIGPSYSTASSVEQRHTATRRAQARLLPSLGVTFRDPLNWQQGEAAERAPDGTHFLRDSYELQAEAVALEASLLLSRAPATIAAVVLGGLGALGLLTWRWLRPSRRSR